MEWTVDGKKEGRRILSRPVMSESREQHLGALLGCIRISHILAVVIEEKGLSLQY